jgi:hypothetical protein
MDFRGNADIGQNRECAAAHAPDLHRGGLGSGRISEVVYGYVAAFPSQLDRDPAADSFGCACHKSGLAFEKHADILAAMSLL